MQRWSVLPMVVAVVGCQVFSHAGEPLEADQNDGGSTTDAYALEVLKDSPRAYYRLDELSGSVAHDSSGNGLDGTIPSTAALGALGALASAPNSHGVELVPESIIFADTDALDTSNFAPYAIEFWIAPTRITGATGMMQQWITRPEGVSSYFDVAGCGTPAGCIGIDFWHGPSHVPIAYLHDGSHALVAGSYTHIVFTAGRGEPPKLYLNGKGPVAVGGMNSSVGHDKINTPAEFGTKNFEGRFDEIALYDHELIATRVKAHFDASGAN